MLLRTAAPIAFRISNGTREMLYKNISDRCSGTKVGWLATSAFQYMYAQYSPDVRILSQCDCILSLLHCDCHLLCHCTQLQKQQSKEIVDSRTLQHTFFGAMVFYCTSADCITRTHCCSHSRPPSHFTSTSSRVPGRFNCRMHAQICRM